MTDKDTVTIKVLPEHLSFGCVSQGYVYQMVVTVINKGDAPQALRVTVSQSETEHNRLRSHFVPVKIAPGTKQMFNIDMIAEHAGAAAFSLHIEQGLNRRTEIKRVNALIVPLDVFKHVAKSLTLQKRPIYRNGVTVKGAIGGMDESRSIVTGTGASVLSEAIMDEADLEEMLDLPLVDGVFFDHVSRTLQVDEKLCAVDVGDWSVEDSIEKTAKLRADRMDQLEDKGSYTLRSIQLAGLGTEGGDGRFGSGVLRKGDGNRAPSPSAGLDTGSSIIGSALKQMESDMLDI
jgi:hypothetical protein